MWLQLHLRLMSFFHLSTHLKMRKCCRHLGFSGVCSNRTAKRDTGTCRDRITELVFVHPAGVALAPNSMASVDSDSDDRLLASLLNWSPSRLMTHDSVTSNSTFYSVMDSPAGPTLVRRTVPITNKYLNREGPFVAQIPHTRIRDCSSRCTFRCTTYRDSDFTHPSGSTVCLHHPRFLEWVGAPESARLLDQDPGAWIRSLSRPQSIDAARQLHRDVCFMTSNLNILDQRQNSWS